MAEKEIIIALFLKIEKYTGTTIIKLLYLFDI